MSRPLRIGLLAEGEAELGRSVPYLKPEDGGKAIEQSEEGALHTLIRRELSKVGISECVFVHRHPTTKERKGKTSILRRGHPILQPKYLSQVVIAWKPDEIDMVVIVVDSDDELDNRRAALDKALSTIRENHLDVNDEEIADQSTGGLAIKSLEAWLLSDIETIQDFLKTTLPENLPELFEDLSADSTDELYAKTLLDNAIEQSDHLNDLTPNKRELEIRWEIAKQADLSKIKSRCPQGYGTFITDLTNTSLTTQARITLPQ